MKVLFTLLLFASLSITLPAQNVTICLDSQTEDGLPIGNVIYHIEPSPPGIPDVLPCQTYPSDNALTITPEKDINHLNGVSTFDLVLIAKHILNVQLLDSPYKLIAADANNSGSVSTIDLLEIRKLIVFQTSEFSNNTSWRFIVDDFVFPDPDNPWGSGPDVCIIPAGTTGTIEKSYIGVKIGDVNLSAYAGDSLLTNESDVRNSQSFNIKEQSFQQGENVTIDFYAEDLAQMAGFQFSFAFDKNVLIFNEAKTGSLKYLDDSCFGLANINEGLVHMSWVNVGMDQNENAAGPLFSLKFTAKKTGSLSEFVSFDPSKLQPELYTSDLEIVDLNLQFSQEEEKTFAEVITSPNPFQEEVTLAFEIQEAGLIELRVLDLKGSVIKTIEQQITSGLNAITLSSDIFPSKGIYFYEINSGEKTQSGQLIKQ